IDLREHQTGVSIKLLRKLPIYGGRNRVECAAALPRNAAAAAEICPSRDIAVLKVVIISTDHIHIFGDGVFRAGPKYLQHLIAETRTTEGRIVDIRVINSSTAGADKVSGNISKGGLRIAGWRELNPFVARIQVKRSVRVFRKQHHAGVIRDGSG